MPDNVHYIWLTTIVISDMLYSGKNINSSSVISIGLISIKCVISSISNKQKHCSVLVVNEWEIDNSVCATKFNPS